ncbi:MAG: hypothetical protein M0C28_39160 [Candidatus Moduliflexus flocculans]|nr:hypothetical protein [Candidatus Moduliflexus flocculans]
MRQRIRRSARPLALGAAVALLLPLLAASLQGAPLERYLAYARASADWTYAHTERASRPMEEDLRSAQRLRLPGAGRAPGNGRHLRLSLRDGEKAGVRRPGQGGPPDLRRLPRPSIPNRRSPCGPITPTASRPCRISSRSCATSGPSTPCAASGASPPPRSGTAAELIAGSMRYLLRTAEWGPMNRSALRAEIPGLGRPGPAPASRTPRPGRCRGGPSATTTGATGRSRTPRSTTASGCIRSWATPTPSSKMPEPLRDAGDDLLRPLLPRT